MYNSEQTQIYVPMSVAQAQQVHCGLPIFQNGYVQPQQQQPMPHPTYSATHK